MDKLPDYMKIKDMTEVFNHMLEKQPEILPLLQAMLFQINWLTKEVDNLSNAVGHLWMHHDCADPHEHITRH